MPPSMRCIYTCEKQVTGPLDREKLVKQLQTVAMTTPDKEDLVQYVPGIIRGKKVSKQWFRTNGSQVSMIV